MMKLLEDRRANAPRAYRTEGATHQWVERRYLDHTLPPPNLIKVSQFWLDYARHDPASGPFTSPHLLEAAHNANAAWLALAVLDLPFDAPKPNVTIEDGKLKVTAQATGLYFYEGEVERALPEEPLLSIRREYFELESKETLTKQSARELRAGVPYGVRLIIMNPTDREMKCELTPSAPDGSIILTAGEDKTELTPRQLKVKAHQILTSEYTFYFPTTGTFKHSRAYITRGSDVIGFSELTTLNAVREVTTLNRESWSEVARLGADDEVLEFLRTHSLRKVSLNAVYNRLPNPKFYKALIELLSAAKLYDQTVWSYALPHRDLERAHELITLNSHLKRSLGPYAELKRGAQAITRLDAYRELTQQHVDFDPLTVARVHSRGAVDAITHADMKRSYLKLLRYLSHKPRAQWSLYDHLGVTYYLIKQGRLDAAQVAFKRAERFVREGGAGEGASPQQRMYYDYLRAYLALSRGDVKRARELALGYQNISHPEWSARFKSIYAPEALIPSTQDESASSSATQSDSLSQSLSVELRGAELIITSHQLKRAELRLYPIDLEVLFSRDPTSLEGAEISVSPLVQPSYREQITLNASGETTLKLPEAWRSRALQVEVRHADLSEVLSYAPRSFKQHIFKQRGLMSIVTSDAPQSPIAGAYVKVYAELKSGKVRFYKDGYTDYRGVFDYVNANPAPQLSDVKRFIMLTLTRGHGASVRSTVPPAR